MEVDGFPTKNESPNEVYLQSFNPLISHLHPYLQLTMEQVEPTSLDCYNPAQSPSPFRHRRLCPVHVW